MTDYYIRVYRENDSFNEYNIESNHWRVEKELESGHNGDPFWSTAYYGHDFDQVVPFMAECGIIGLLDGGHDFEA